MKRRTVLYAGIGAGIAGVLTPLRALGAYPTKAFLAKEIPDALREAFGTADIGESDKIEIDAPHIATDANMVPVRVKSGFDNTESIAIVVSGNPSPFSAYFRLYEAQNFVTTRVRVADTSDLLVIVKADGGLHTRKRAVRVGRNECRA